MENKRIIDLAYDLAKTKYKNKAFTFEELWKDLIRKCRLDAQEQKNAGHIYTYMLQDHRFIFVGKGEWRVREFLKLEEQQALSNALYEFKEVQEEGEEAEAAKLASINDKEMQDQEMYYDEDTLEEMYQESKSKLDDEEVEAEDDDPESTQETDEEEEK